MERSSSTRSHSALPVCCCLLLPNLPSSLEMVHVRGLADAGPVGWPRHASCLPISRRLSPGAPGRAPRRPGEPTARRREVSGRPARVLEFGAEDGHDQTWRTTRTSGRVRRSRKGEKAGNPARTPAGQGAKIKGATTSSAATRAFREGGRSPLPAGSLCLLPTCRSAPLARPVTTLYSALRLCCHLQMTQARQLLPASSLVAHSVDFVDDVPRFLRPGPATSDRVW